MVAKSPRLCYRQELIIRHLANEKKWLDEATGLCISSHQWRIPYCTLKQLTAFKDEPIEFRLSSDWFRPFIGAATNTMDRRCEYWQCHVTGWCSFSSSFCRACRSFSNSHQRFWLDSAPSRRGRIFGLNLAKHCKEQRRFVTFHLAMVTQVSHHITAGVTFQKWNAFIH